MVELESILVAVHRQDDGSIVIQVLNRPAFGLSWLKKALTDLPYLNEVDSLPEEKPQSFGLTFDHQLDSIESRTLAEWAVELLVEADRKVSPNWVNFEPAR